MSFARLEQLLAAAVMADGDGRRATAKAIRRTIDLEFPRYLKEQSGTAREAPGTDMRDGTATATVQTSPETSVGVQPAAPPPKPEAVLPPADAIPVTAPPLAERHLEASFPWRVFFADMPTVRTATRSQAERVVERRHPRYAEVHHVDGNTRLLWLNGAWRPRQPA